MEFNEQVKSVKENIVFEAKFGNAARYVKALIDNSDNTASLYFVLDEAITQLRSEGFIKSHINYRTAKPLNESRMSRSEAIKYDTKFYVKGDQSGKYRKYKVVGNNSDYIYSEHDSKEAAQNEIDAMEQKKVKMRRSRKKTTKNLKSKNAYKKRKRPMWRDSW